MNVLLRSWTFEGEHRDIFGIVVCVEYILVPGDPPRIYTTHICITHSGNEILFNIFTVGKKKIVKYIYYTLKEMSTENYGGS